MKNQIYSRRQFVKRNTLVGVGTLTMGIASGCSYLDGQKGRETSRLKEIGQIGGATLEQLRDAYEAELFGRFIPNMDELVIDHEHGGFMCSVDIITRERMADTKTAWYEGRGLWAYSFLYNNFGQDPRFLEVATKSKDFILTTRPTDGSFWAASFDRTGTTRSGAGNIYGDLFIAEGLAEFAKASGQVECFDLAKSLIMNCLDRYDRPDYEYHVGYLAADAPKVEGPRVLGHWMVFLRAATQLLDSHNDSDIEQLAERCVDAIMNCHLNPECGLMNELLNHDLSLPDNAFASFSYVGHAIETLWMVMFEAHRTKDPELFHRAAESFKRHAEVAADRVYGGFFRSLDHVDDYVWKVDKVLWLQEEVLIGTLFMIEHTGDLWAKRCFAETLRYVKEKFTNSSYAFWISAGDRTLATFHPVRVEHYHHPRHLMLNVLALNRMLERRGKVSGEFDE